MRWTRGNSVSGSWIFEEIHYSPDARFNSRCGGLTPGAHETRKLQGQTKRSLWVCGDPQGNCGYLQGDCGDLQVDCWDLDSAVYVQLKHLRKQRELIRRIEICGLSGVYPNFTHFVIRFTEGNKSERSFRQGYSCCGKVAIEKCSLRSRYTKLSLIVDVFLPSL